MNGAIWQLDPRLIWDPEHAAAQVLLNIREQEETDAMFRAREVRRVAAND